MYLFVYIYHIIFLKAIIMVTINNHVLCNQGNGYHIIITLFSEPADA